MVFASFFRIGEAKTPGPDPSGLWTLGVCNPSGVFGKSMQLAQLQADFLAISETHLTKSAARTFQSSMRAASHMRHVVTGAPVQARFVDSDAGQWSGVAAVSAFPCRSLCMQWPPDLYDNGRVQIVGTHVANTWITGGIVYGFPASKYHRNPLQRTDDILQVVVSHLLSNATGPRFVCGDWNHLADSLPVTKVLHQHGWKEVQTLQLLHHGTPIKATCKKLTQKDFCWVSPELARCFRHTEVLDDVFADHSILRTEFAVAAQDFCRYVWPTPQPVPWQQLELDLPVVSFGDAEDPTEQFQQVWQQCEAAAQNQLGSNWRTTMGGRAQQLKPRKIVGWAAPPKKGRSCDVQPTFLGYDHQHCQWLKQLRRLDNYRHWAQQHFATTVGTARVHGIELWSSVLHAKGFPQGFERWWQDREHVMVGDPFCIPGSMPNPEVAHQVFFAFQSEVRWLESQLRSAKQSYRKWQHETNPNLVFRDVRRPSPEPVTSLLQVASSHVTEVDPTDCAILIDPPQQFNPEVPVTVQGKPVHIVHATPDKLYLASTEGMAPSQQVEQARPIGRLDAIFDAFHTQWKQRWCRRDRLPHSHWDEIIAFSRKVMPWEHISHLAVTATLFRAEINQKKQTSATGLDGISRHDLLTIGPNQLESIACMFRRAERTGDWPAQTTAGKVASLAKKVDARGTNDYRPITVFSLCYRGYSSLQSRHLLDRADAWCDSDIHGNRKGHQTMHLWSQIIDSIQLAYDQNRSLSGLTADIEKAYNCLPRLPILAASLAAGTPMEVLRAWSGALASMVRHFRVDGSYSAGFYTSTGLAEGCGLSCYGMLVLDHIFHRWIHWQAPDIRVLSFVDNWDSLTWNPEAATRQLSLLLQFCAKVDLTVDRHKTFGWSTSAAVRKQFRQAGVPVKRQAKDLGAHLGFSKQFTNSSQVQRLQELEDFWKQLQGSHAPYRSKVRMLKTVAWPRGLRAISAAPLGNQQWLQARRHANKAIGMQKPGVNPLILLGMVEQACDPYFVGVLQTVLVARQMKHADFWQAEVFPVAMGVVSSNPTSQVAILVNRLQSLGFGVQPDGSLLDRVGSFHPARVNYSELLVRFQAAWVRYVASQVRHRQDFAGLHVADTGTTQKALHALLPDEQAMMRLGLAGGQFTQDAHANWDTDNTQCKWCGEADSLSHKYFECAHTRSIRERLAPTVIQHLPELPPVLTLRGWAVHPPSWVEWQQLLLKIPVDVSPLHTKFHAGMNHVFTDGSCFQQSQASVRVAGWGAVLAHQCSAEWSGGFLGILGSGPLPGLVQTAYRAELYSVAFVVHHAAVAQVDVTLYSDCLGVVNRCLLMLSGTRRAKVNSPNADLWMWLQDSLDHLGRRRVQIVKTKAHRELHTAKNLSEAWQIVNNATVDGVARHATLQRSDEFWALWKQLVREVAVTHQLHAEVFALHLAVAKCSVLHMDPVDPPAQPQEKAKRSFPMTFDTANWDGRVPAALCHEYGEAMVRRLLGWWNRRTTGDNVGEVRWVTFAHLYIDFQQSTGSVGPIKFKKQWLDASTRPYMEPERFTFLQRLKWFRRFLKVFWKQSQIKVGLATCKGAGEAIHAFVACASLQWEHWAFAKTDLWLMSQLRSPCLKGTTVLEHLPLAQLAEEMVIEPVAQGPG
eukprot:Skav235179  [mRNA]  locus=scaffold721:273036:277949:- [translate_table: standard]